MAKMKELLEDIPMDPYFEMHPYDQGRDAYWSGRENPFEKGSRHWEQFHEGFMRSYREDSYEEL